MAATKLPTVTAWSYSRYADYAQCPAKFKYKHLERRPDPGSAAMQRGNDVHKELETLVKAGRAGDGEGAPVKVPPLVVPPQFKNFAQELQFLRDNNAVVEQAWGFRQGWEWTGKPGWFGDDVWFRAKLDAAVIYDDDTALVIDWKTGKKYQTNEEQIELFSLAVFKRYPQLTAVDTRLWYTDAPAHDNEVRREYTLKEAGAIQRDWEKKIVPMFTDRKFPPKPNDKCHWCNFSKAKGGPCKF